MPGNKTVDGYLCFRKLTVSYSGIFIFVGLPVNFVLLKALIKTLELRLARHKILLSLTISDCLQILLNALLQLFASLLGLKTTEVACRFCRRSIEFISMITLVGSTGSILALSVERYIACIHCFRVHQIVTDKRVIRALSGIWAVGVICALTNEKFYSSALSSSMMNPFTQGMSIIYVIVVVIASAILIVIQARLYKLSHRLMKVHPGNRVGSNAEAHDLRRRQLKLSIVASAVIVLYMICMCPLAGYIVLTSFKETAEMTKTQESLLLLALVNTFIDPFVYGLGMEDTRRAIKRELKKFRDFFCGLVDNQQD